MPVIKSAIKKLRKDRKRERENDAFRNELDKTVKEAKKLKTSKAVSSASSILDRAVKKNLLHKNRAARIKSSLAKLAGPVKGKAKLAEKTTSVKTKSVTKTKSKKTQSKPPKKTSK